MSHGSAAADRFDGDGHLTDAALAEIASAHHGVDLDGPSRVPAGAAEHLIACRRCRDALSATERVVEALRRPPESQDPPPGLWDRIADDVADAPRPSGGTRRGRPGWLVPVAAAAAGVLVGAAVAVGLAAGSQDPEDPEDSPPDRQAVVVGDVALEPVASEDFEGRAEMTETEAGELELTVELEGGSEPEEGYFEVWLRDAEADRLISLGVVTSQSTTFPVPAGIDLEEYPVVDVSHEHFDGDPGHSGTTMGEGAMAASEGE